MLFGAVFGNGFHCAHGEHGQQREGEVAAVVHFFARGGNHRRQAGRAGRAELPGRVFIQTRLPEHRVYQTLLRQNYADFAAGELAERESFDMPPFAHTAAVRADAANMADALEMLRLAAEWVAQQRLPESAENEAKEVLCLGPVPMLLAKLAGRERAQVFLESPNRKALHRQVSLWQQALATLAQKAT